MGRDIQCLLHTVTSLLFSLVTFKVLGSKVAEEDPKESPLL